MSQRTKIKITIEEAAAYWSERIDECVEVWEKTNFQM